MKIDIFSDLHLDHWMIKLYRDRKTNEVLDEFIKAGRTDADTVIFAGDAGNGYHYYKLVVNRLKLHYKNVIACPGNHCFYRDGDFLADHMTGGLVEGKSFAATPLWTNFRNKNGFGELAEKNISDWLYIDALVNYDKDLVDAPWKIMYQEYYVYRDRLIIEKPEIAVTHFAPIVQSVHPKYAGDALNTYFCNDDERMFNAVGARLWVHGHTHSEFDYRHNGTRVVAHPIGYPWENYSELIGIPMKTVEI